MGKLLDMAQNIEQRMISEAIRQKPSDLRLARLMFVILGGSAISCVILLSFSYVTSEGEGWIAIVMLFGHLTVCSSIFTIKYVDSMVWPTRLLALLGALQLVVATSVSGGPDSSVLYALPVLPIFLSTLVDIRTNIASSLIVLIGVSTIFFVDRVVAPFPEVNNSAWESVFVLFWVVFMALGIAGYSQHQANRLLIVAEKELEQRKVAQGELAQVNESKDRFLAYMSHEMRNSLAAIVGAVDLLGMPKMKSEHPRYLESLNNSANSLREIVDTVLDFSQIDSGLLTFDLEPIRIEPFLTDVTSQFSVSAETSGLSLNCEIVPGAPNFVVANKTRLRQVLSNLLSNAIKFSNAGGSVHLRVTLNPEDNEGALFVVEDTGIGIRQEDQAKIFVPYERSNVGLSRKGTGLGLPIAQVLLEKMGAILKLESELEKGSRFYFVLPSVSDPPASVSISTETRQTSLSGTSVLVAEDNVPASVVTIGILRAMGCKVWHARNGKEAVSLYKEFNPDCVLMDIQMPIMNGVEATREIRKFEQLNGIKETYILVVTGELNQEGLTGNEDFNGLLQKPFSPPDLLEMISGTV